MSDSKAMIKPTMHHVNLKTNRLKEMIEWYALVVGTKVNFQFPGGAFISNDRANHRIALLAVPGLTEDPQKFTHTGLHHTAFEYGSFADLMSSYARLKKEGIEPQVCLNHVTPHMFISTSRLGIARGGPDDDEHLPTGLSPLEGLPFRMMRGSPDTHKIRSLPASAETGVCIYPSSRAFGGHDVPINYLATVSLPDGQCLFISR
jgi:hypothetical protein